MIKVALIDDDPEIVAEISRYILSTIDMELVAAAANFADGQVLIKSHNFDVLLCDLGLPDGSGINLVRECTKLKPNTDIIVITVFAEQTKVISAIKAGARSYILKDEKLEDCINAIRETINGGSAISPAIARHLVKILHPANKSEIEDDEILTARESEILNLLARGFSVAEISKMLRISSNTIATHVKSIYKKLEVNSRSEAIFEATTRGIIDFN